MDGRIDNTPRDDKLGRDDPNQLVEADDWQRDNKLGGDDPNKLVEEDDDEMPPLVCDGDNHASDSFNAGQHQSSSVYCYYPRSLSMYPITTVPDLQKGEWITEPIIFVNALTGHRTPRPSLTDGEGVENAWALVVHYDTEPVERAWTGLVPVVQSKILAKL